MKPTHHIETLRPGAIRAQPDPVDLGTSGVPDPLQTAPLLSHADLPTLEMQTNPRLKLWSDRLGDALDSLSAEEKARLDREYRALVESREPIPGDDQWLDEGPDPFGMDWAWCDGPFDDLS